MHTNSLEYSVQHDCADISLQLQYVLFIQHIGQLNNDHFFMHIHINKERTKEGNSCDTLIISTAVTMVHNLY